MLYLTAIRLITEKTGNPDTLATEAVRIGNEYDMPQAAVFDDLRRFRAMLCRDATGHYN